jgi:hypothetical protein
MRETEPLASEAQVNYLVALRQGKDLSSLTQEQVQWLANADFTKVPKRRASDVIEQLVALPWSKKSADTLHGDTPPVADGRYAVEKDDGTLMFYSVKNGRYKTFVDVWASDARWPVQNDTERVRILTAIQNDPDAGPRFGREIGRCYVCGRTLTDEHSRQLGIGPVCRGDQ